MLRYVIPLAIWLAATSAWAQQTPPPAEPSKGGVSMEEPQPGDHWIYEERDEITGKVVATRENAITEVTPKEISLRFRVVGTSNEGFNVYDRSWNLLNSPSWRYSPYQGSVGIRAPLTVGKTWAFESNNINTANGNIWKETGTSKVVGQETLITKAGTFETFKIETNFSTRSTKDPAKKNEFTFQTWYAPAIDHWVKRITVVRVDKHLKDNNTWELIEYGRKQ
jgi:hypothetical protein